MQNFLVGVSTAAHQIEGNNIFSDWWKFEKLLPRKVESGLACNSYNLYKEDTKALKDIGCNSYRFSLEWSRIEPQEGEFSTVAINHYKDVIKDLKENNIEPIVTLHHFTNPLWIEENGGWYNAQTITFYERYVEKVLNELGGQVNYWITINEPNAYVVSKYLVGEWFPNKTNLNYTIKAGKNLLNAHKVGFKVIKKHNPNAKVGLAIQSVRFIPKRSIFYLFNLALTSLLNYINNWFTHQITSKHVDFLGVNFYTRIQLNINLNEKFLISMKPNILNSPTLKFDQYPNDLFWIVNKLKRFNKPILITENGIPTENDLEREFYLKEIFINLEKIVENNINIIGYQHWSLIDNFEWEFGYTTKFGLYEFDKNTFKRIAKKSSLVYKNLIEQFLKKHFA